MVVLSVEGMARPFATSYHLGNVQLKYIVDIEWLLPLAECITFGLRRSYHKNGKIWLSNNSLRCAPFCCIQSEKEVKDRVNPVTTERCVAAKEAEKS
jgi:hypothetical protein